MKQKLSVSIDEETVRVIEERVREGSFRNKSHVIEYALIRFLRENQLRGEKNGD